MLARKKPNKKGTHIMKKNFLEETYGKIQEAKKAYHAANDEAGKNAAIASYQEAEEAFSGLKGAELRVWKAYESSMDRGNEYIDFDSVNCHDNIEHLVSCMKDYGIKAFMFSSTWGGAVETAWLFQKAGCKLAGLIEINSSCKAFMSDEYEKLHGYLFELN